MNVDRVTDIRDLAAIAALERECFHSPWSQDMLTSSYNSDCVFIVAREGKDIIGYGGFYPTGDITNIAVTETARHRGVGRAIVEALVCEARERGIDSLFLEVRESNRVARRLYERCGFNYISTRKRYYENGEDAYIYSRRCELSTIDYMVEVTN